MSALPDGGEWATAPLLDPANVGRYVWYVFNSNAKWATPLPIVKIGRTNVHVGTRGARPSSLRVNPDNPSRAFGTNGSGYSESCYTEQSRLDEEAARPLIVKLNDTRFSRLPLPVLERIADLVRADGLTDRRAADRDAIARILAEELDRPVDDHIEDITERICTVFYGP